MTLWWLSFRDPARPEGQRFFDAAVVEGEDMLGAVQAAWNQGLHPGGEVEGWKLPPDTAIPEEFQGRPAAVQGRGRAAGKGHGALSIPGEPSLPPAGASFAVWQRRWARARLQSDDYAARPHGRPARRRRNVAERGGRRAA